MKNVSIITTKQGQTIYTPHPLDVKTILGFIVFIAMGAVLVFRGWRNYSLIPPDHTVAQFNEVKAILVGGVCSGLFLFALVARIEGLRRKLPRLTLDAQGFKYQSLSGRTLQGEWNSIGPFKVTFTRRGAQSTITAPVVGLNVNPALKEEGTLSFAGQIFVGNLHILAIELNRRRAIALNIEYVPPDELALSKKPLSKMRLLQSILFCIFWIVGITLALFSLGTWARHQLNLPRQPYDLVLLAVALLVSLGTTKPMFRQKQQRWRNLGN